MMINKYVGIKYNELNCWQLFCKVQKEVFNISLPDHEVPDSREDKHNIFTNHDERQNWYKVITVKPGDAVLMGKGKHSTHIGTVVDNNKILHTTMNYGAVIHRKQEIRLMGYKIFGYFRRLV